MKKIAEDIKEFLNCKAYVLALSIVAICGYGFTVTHYSIGIDDTAIPLYFKDGMAPFVGRWWLFLVNKLFRIDDFAPWMIEFASILIFMISVTLWCVLFRRICRRYVDIPLWSYLFVAGIFISCPIISEIYVFYLHNGICSAYGFVALSLLCLTDSLNREIDKKAQLIKLLESSIFLTIALGCYESFVIVYAIGAVMSFFLMRRLYGKKGDGATYEVHTLSWIIKCGLTGILSLLFRFIILFLVKIVFGLNKFSEYNVAYRSLVSGISDNTSEMVMVLKRYWLKFFVNGVVYLPITVLVVTLFAISLYSLYYGFRKKDILMPLCSIAIVVLPITLCIIEGVTTRYRTSQYIPLVGAFAVMLLMVELNLYKKAKYLKVACYALLSILLFNQCGNLNQWFYLDYLKYEYTKETMNQIAYDLEKNYDTSKPIIFRGAHRVPYEISKPAYCSFDSKQYQIIRNITDLVDPHLAEKYNADNGKGYVFAETPVASTLQWGVTAFDGTAGQLIEFWKMHGHSFICETDLSKIENAEHIRKEVQMPGYPKEGYIMEREDYIIVNIESQK